MRVDFLVCGVQKAGTSAMDQYLRQHPELCLARRKEVHYFDDDDRFDGSKVDHTWYHNWFLQEGQHKSVGECTPIYLFWNHSLERIQAYNPSMKLIVILRNPIERAFSHWAMESARGHEDRSFKEAIRAELNELNSGSKQCRVRSYIARGLYCGQLYRMWSLFPKEQTLIIRHESLLTRPQEVMQDAFKFLGAYQSFRIDEVIENASDYPCELSTAERSMLVGVFSDEIQRLELLLGWDCRGWIVPD